ncbi:MAG: hypothetical protein A2X47_13760 [Lentisphaerae bacterium GWF2_38_69]|nr:MAG: hypothetical protein A2X47_13760 [Lentisphaerae bacterium GWF2_38_69]
MYPLLFKPIYKEVIWGGNMIESHLGREVPKRDMPIGEAWEIVDRPDAQSIVESGSLQGKTLRELIETYESSIVGQNYTGKPFPLLVKIIDAGQRLSLQVHPDEAACRKLKDAQPKTEMWYIIAAHKDAKIYCGLSHKATKGSFINTCQSLDVEKYLQTHRSNPGDAFFISAGTVHAIGEGNLLFEVQQNSDTTYRISDWGRVGSDGKSRELHLEKAMECIHFIQRSSSKITGVTGTVPHNRKFPIIQYCSFFKVDDLRLAGKWDDTTIHKGVGSFQIITAVNRSVKIQKENDTWEIPRGRSALLPSSFGQYSILADETTETTVLKTQA